MKKKNKHSGESSDLSSQKSKGIAKMIEGMKDEMTPKDAERLKMIQKLPESSAKNDDRLKQKKAQK